MSGWMLSKAPSMCASPKFLPPLGVCRPSTPPAFSRFKKPLPGTPRRIFRIWKFELVFCRESKNLNFTAMETVRTPVHRAIFRPASTELPTKILPGAHKPRPAAQPTVDEILNKTARGEQVF